MIYPTTLHNTNSIYLSANVSTFLTADLVLGSLFCTRYKYKSLKYWLSKYPTCISFTVTGKYIPFRTFLCIIFNILSILAYLGKNIYTSLPVSTWLCTSGGSLKYDLSGLWYISDIIPSQCGDFSSKSVNVLF